MWGSITDWIQETTSITDWIQATTAAAIVVLTFFLVRYTRRYVKHVADHADLARQHIQLIESERIALRNELNSLMLRVYEDLRQVPTDSGTDLRRAQLPSEGDMALLRRLASSVSRRASSFAAILDRNVNWLRARIDDVRRNPGASFDWEAWREHLSKADWALGQLVKDTKDEESEADEVPS